MAFFVGLAVFVVAAAVLFAVAWWSSGRSRHTEPDSTARADLARTEAKTMGQYRPTGGNGPGPVL